MSGICSKHRGHEPTCELCNASAPPAEGEGNDPNRCPKCGHTTPRLPLVDRVTGEPWVDPMPICEKCGHAYGAPAQETGPGEAGDEDTLNAKEREELGRLLFERCVEVLEWEDLSESRRTDYRLRALSMFRKGFNAGRASTAAAKDLEPIDMILFCPKCGKQHIDAPNPEKNWSNHPHRSHECQFCRHTWRPSDTATNGVATIATGGARDDAPVLPENTIKYWQNRVRELETRIGLRRDILKD